MDITALLKNANLNTILNTDKLPDEIVLHRQNFKDLVKNIDTSANLKEEEIDMYLRMISDEDFISLIEGALTEENYKSIDQEVYAILNNKYKPKKRAFTFIQEKHLHKCFIRAYTKYDWILKAMAIDYCKYLGQGLMETYKEYFEDNTRIIEETLLKQEFVLSNNHWILDKDTNILIYTLGKKEVQYTVGEAESRFEQLL